VVKITELGRSLERKTGSIRNCIEQGTISPALVRLAGNVRTWPVAEAPGKPALPSRCGAVE
jgi:hypothetical protein